MSYESGVRSERYLGSYRQSNGAITERGALPMEAIGRTYETHPGAPTRPDGGRRRVAMQLILPVLLLGGLEAAAYFFADRPVAWPLLPAVPWLTYGDLILPLTFFAIELTNRRFGAGHAAGQTLLAWLIGGIALWIASDSLPAFAGRPLPPLTQALGFGAGLFLAQLASVIVFDRMRGPRWWVAPLFATLIGGLLFCGIGFPLAHIGGHAGWIPQMLGYAALMAASALVLLLPYWLLRPVLPPQWGLGGY